MNIEEHLGIPRNVNGILTIFRNMREWQGILKNIREQQRILQHTKAYCDEYSGVPESIKENQGIVSNIKTNYQTYYQTSTNNSQDHGILEILWCTTERQNQSGLLQNIKGWANAEDHQEYKRISSSHTVVKTRSKHKIIVRGTT